MKKRIRKIIGKITGKKSASGFTLAETLICVLILLMVSAVVAAGIPSASNAYRKVVVASNAEVLLSTALTTLRNELGTAEDINIVTVNSETSETVAEEDGDHKKTGTGIVYYNELVRSTSRIRSGSNGEIMYQRYHQFNGVGNNGAENPLISDSRATEELKVVFENVTYNVNTNVITFKGLKVMNGDKVVETLNDGDSSFSIRVL